MLAFAFAYPISAERIAYEIRFRQIATHLNAFQTIADQHSGSRSVSNGYLASLAYVKDQLEKHTDYTVRPMMIKTDHFDVPVWAQQLVPSLSFQSSYGISGTPQLGVDFVQMRNVGNLTYSQLTRGLIECGTGCQVSDYSMATGQFALISLSSSNSSNDCSTFQKVVAATNAGVTALFIYNDYNASVLPLRIRLPKIWTPIVQIPVFSLKYSLGETFKQLSRSQFSSNAVGTPTSSLNLTISVSSSVTLYQTSNLYCYTSGDPNNKIVIGAHLDSVPEAPGIDDNGSGSAAILELVLQLSKHHFKPKNQLIFAWWAAEELGLMGSRYFVSNYEELQTIKLALNFDMLGAPNGIPFIHSTSVPLLPGSSPFPPSFYPGSNQITPLFAEYFDKSKFPYELDSFDYKSDFFSFAEVGIPAGGLATGAGEKLTMAQRINFGKSDVFKIANAPFDPCWHKSCDSIENIDPVVCERNAAAAAYVVVKLAGIQDLTKWLGN